ncbi:sulfotransferase family 2 domain-containing protein [Microbulbifer sp. JTAC008]|uniref:sulfotransferase family 2 domain-containing protein n=1 Tax=unclassified Microbulbifer TaxID=2619833 RepID=UPI004039DEB2
MKPIVFVHIPKTAGTSFRWGADSYFGKESVCRDYGVKSVETSELVRSWTSSEKDGWLFAQEFSRRGYQFLTGHFYSAKYINIFDAGRMVTFLRDPIQRIASEYNHCVRHNGYKDSFEDFYRSPQNINRQLKIIGRKSWAEFGFIGFVDAYQDSLCLLNKRFNIEIPYLHENVAKSEVVEPRQLTKGQLQELRNLNAEELKFYNLARSQFDWNLRANRAGNNYVSGCVTNFESGKLQGWAISENADEAVLVQAKVGDNIIAESKANEYRPYYKARGLGRGGFLGFTIKIPSSIDPNNVVCVVANTGQPILNTLKE